MHFRLFVVCVAALAGLTGCPGGKVSPGSAGKHGGSIKPTLTAQAAAQQYALFSPRQQVGSVPVAWSLSYDGTRLLGLTMAEQTSAVWSWDLTGPVVGEPERLAEQPNLRAFVAANQDGTRALAAALENGPHGATDVYWLFSGGTVTPQRLDYTHAADLPAKLPPGLFEGNAPLFSGDGQLILIPLKTAGIIVLPVSGGAGQFVALPSFGDVQPESVTISILPPLNGKQYVCASLAAMESMGKDYCQLQFLDLATMHWESVTRFNTWLPLVVGCPDFHTQPWVQLGSRPRDTVEEPARVAKLALFDPQRQLPQEVPYLNDVELDDLTHFRLDITGEHLVCFDPIRQAVVRYRLRDGQLEVDPRIYLPQAQLYTNRDSSVVLLLQDNLVMRVEFSQTEDLPGYADSAATGSSEPGP